MLNATPARFNKGQRAMGWAAVVMSALLGAFLGMFAGGEGATEGWGRLSWACSTFSAGPVPARRPTR